MYGYIYKTTNLVNGKIYVGQHKWDYDTIDLNYIGSGKLLNESINKYGIDNFKCEILEWCLTKDLLNEREIYWIDKLNSMNKDTGYNLTKGGDGGDTWNNHSDEEKLIIISKIKAPTAIEKQRKTVLNKYANGFKSPCIGSKRTSEQKQKMQENHANYKGENNPFYGKHHSDNTKESIRNKQKDIPVIKRVKDPKTYLEHMDAVKKNRKIKHWYNNGIQNIYISDDEKLPNGFVKGRLQLKKWYNNSIINIYIDSNISDIPDGFIPGRIVDWTSYLRSDETKLKLSISHKGKNLNNKNAKK